MHSPTSLQIELHAVQDMSRLHSSNSILSVLETHETRVGIHQILPRVGTQQHVCASFAMRLCLQESFEQAQSFVGFVLRFVVGSIKGPQRRQANEPKLPFLRA
jgi:hypothetical protein